MKAQWNPVPSDRPGVSHYHRQDPKGEAWIERKENGSAEASQKNGFFGPSVESWHAAPAPTDSVILQKMDEVAHPPRFDDWKEVKHSPELPSVKHYEGRETGGMIRSKVEVFIDRDGDQADYTAKVGRFGEEVEGHLFAPAPSDQEILHRLSESH